MYTSVNGFILLLWLCLAAPQSLWAQDLEPRRWTHLPVGSNYISAFTVDSSTDVFLDPVLLIEDGEADFRTAGFSYLHAFDLAGKSARFDVTVPYASGRWEGLLDGEYASRRRRGFGDPRIRLSMNLYGAPPLSGKAFLQYRQNNPVSTTVGAAIDVLLPVGEYNSDWLLNLGGNRYVFRPQLGVLHQRHKWQFEATGSVFLFQDNDEFWRGSKLEQDPLWFLQGHVIYGFKPGWWASVSAGYAYGGEATVSGVPKNNDARSSYWALSFGMPLSARQALKLTWVTADTHIRAGANTDALLAAWSINWSR